MRTHYCGATKDVAVGETVTICGWVDRRRDHGGVIFLDMRDREGIVQVVFDPDTKEYFDLADRVRSEYVLQITGRIRNRATETINPAMATGHIEILGKDSMQRNLISRSRITSTIRTYLESAGFLDIETPVLTRATPEGARDYLVPSRTNASKFFALPQSPQLFKQLLMVSGFDRYYQIARCFRDEDLRADRQPEFTQIDIELSFTDESEVMSLTEGMVKELFAQHLNVDLGAFPRMTWHEAMERFGSDKPDLRIDLELVSVDDLMADVEFKVFSGPANDEKGRVAGLRVPGGAKISRK